MGTTRWRTVRYLVMATLARRRRGLVALVVLVALVGGVSMGAIAAARRTQSAYPAYLASSRASQLELFVYRLNSPSGIDTPESITRKLEALPQVSHVATAPAAFLTPAEPAGIPAPAPIVDNDVNFEGSLGGAFFTQDRPALAAGRMAHPNSPDEIVASADAARLLGWHVGQRIVLDAYSLAQVAAASSFPPPDVAPASHVTVTLVGIVVFANQVAHDDADRYPTYVLLTPALTRRLTGLEGFSNYELRIRGGDPGVAAVQREITSLLPPGSVYAYHLTSVVEGQVERAIRPETIALAVFGAIAAAAALFIGAQSLRRLTWTHRDEIVIARALGADRATLAASSALGASVALVAGTLLAMVAAVAFSPLAPVGAVRAIDPSPGLNADWTVLLVGAAVLLLVLGACTVAFGLGVVRRAPRGIDDAPSRRSVISDAAARAGLPVPVVAGLRFSLESNGRSSGPTRSALLASVVAVVVAATTVTFASGLSTLDSHPALYGWNWSFGIISPTGSDIPPVAGHRLSADPDVASWTGYGYANVQIDGVTVPIILASPHAVIGPPLIAGHELDAVRQIVLGPETLAQLHKKLGGTVIASYGSPKDYPVYVPPIRLKIVGVATMPAVGNSGNLHTSMGLGAMIATGTEPKAFREALTQPDPNLNGPEIDVVQLRHGISTSTGLASLRRIAALATTVMDADPNGAGASYVVIGPQRPAEIVIYESAGSAPALLALALSAAAVAGLGLALASSVRRRRRDLALLKTLGLRRRQLAATIAWQSSTVAVVGSLFGVPIGIALGRWLWTLFAQQIGAVPRPTVPVAEVALIAVGALVLANVVAAIPGRIAARTPAALVLRSE